MSKADKIRLILAIIGAIVMYSGIFLHIVTNDTLSSILLVTFGFTIYLVATIDIKN